MLQRGVEQTLSMFVYNIPIHCVVNTEVFKTKLTVDVLNYDQLF